MSAIQVAELALNLDLPKRADWCRTVQPRLLLRSPSPFPTVMCKHVLNAQVSIRAPCCKQWYDCAECHAENQTHKLAKTLEMAFLCKKCKKAFRKDMSAYEESDEYCPHCDNHYVIDAKTPQPVLTVDAGDVRKDARIIKDERAPNHARNVVTDEELAGLLED